MVVLQSGGFYCFHRQKKKCFSNLRVQFICIGFYVECVLHKIGMFQVCMPFPCSRFVRHWHQATIKLQCLQKFPGTNKYIFHAVRFSSTLLLSIKSTVKSFREPISFVIIKLSFIRIEIKWTFFPHKLEILRGIWAIKKHQIDREFRIVGNANEWRKRNCIIYEIFDDASYDIERTMKKNNSIPSFSTISWGEFSFVDKHVDEVSLSATALSSRYWNGNAIFHS